MRIRVIWEGRTKNPHLHALQEDFARRIAHFTDFGIEEMAPARHARPGGAAKLSSGERRLLAKLEGGTRVFLDERGREWSSEEFAEWLGQQALRGTRDLAFVVGGRDGFTGALRQRADLLLALSRLTLTRDWARTLLLEQIYRGFTILRGYPYPR